MEDTSIQEPGPIRTAIRRTTGIGLMTLALVPAMAALNPILNSRPLQNLPYGRTDAPTVTSWALKTERYFFCKESHSSIRTLPEKSCSLNIDARGQSYEGLREFTSWTSGIYEPLLGAGLALGLFGIGSYMGASNARRREIEAEVGRKFSTSNA